MRGMVGAAVALGVVWMALAQGVVERARGLWEGGERVEVIGVLERAVEGGPGDGGARGGLAEAELAVDRCEAALKHAAGLGGEMEGLRGTAWFRLGELGKALEHLGR